MYKRKRKNLRRKKSGLSLSWKYCLPLTVIILLVWSYAAVAQDLTKPEDIQKLLDTLWVVFAGFLVFFMNAGFAMLETGFCRRKNAVNMLAKNLIVFALSTVAYWAIGFSLMFSNGDLDPGLGGIQGIFFSGREADYEGVFSSLDWTNVPLKAKFFFQLVFAGTAATIVSGAVAERIKFEAFIIFSLFLVGISYPITGHWIWGGGWLQDRGFWDFAGSTVVHSVGGWAALTGAILLGPRIGKYKDDGESLPLAGHNLSISTLGCFILWLGWFGFNPGSTMAADPDAITHIILTTNMAAATGAIFAAGISKWRFGNFDLTMIINGVLAGLVAITASCAFVGFGVAIFIGAIAGIIVVFSVYFLDQWKIDDPVGAISVHLVCGIWGTLAVGLFSVGPKVYSWYGEGEGPAPGLFQGGGLNQVMVQILGIVSVGVFTVVLSWIIWSAIKAIVGLRVSQKEELKGLDIGEHGMLAYSGFALKPDTTQALAPGEETNQQQSSS